MARAMPTFKAYDYDALPQEIKEHLAIIDEAKAEINKILGAGLPPTHKVIHSYKLDYAAGKRVFKVAVVAAAKARAVAPALPSGNLNDWIKQQVNDGRGV